MRKLIDWIKSYLTYPDPEVSWIIVLVLIVAGIMLTLTLTGCQPEPQPHGGIYTNVCRSWSCISDTAKIQGFSLIQDENGGYNGMIYEGGTAVFVLNGDTIYDGIWRKSAEMMSIYGNGREFVTGLTVSHDTLSAFNTQYVRSY
jgi:hypothetical protein